MAVISYKCPNCDGELVFHPATQKYKCEYCASAFSQEELEKMKPAMEEEKKITMPQEEQPAAQGERTGEQEKYGRREDYSQEGADKEGVMYSCPSCGAEIVTDQTTAATFC